MRMCGGSKAVGFAKGVYRFTNYTTVQHSGGTASCVREVMNSYTAAVPTHSRLTAFTERTTFHFSSLVTSGI